ncbi:DUF2974 domain-containing protein [Alloscardovia theropitheci]|uniref:DUF2974 domain-containing protein n=1 Tax=Alloscardovia theropitheci TaxID=2496842 RepID=A0A4R0QND9_9BIFI|nr:Mbeg1-like protein [Alloscardovia theropitheci]TCD53702.1 DUF2974 domain-containing protein [Alloscardovia theropitheci]
MTLGTITTYAQEMLKTFEETPFNDVDAAILSQLSYAQLDGGIVPTLETTRQLSRLNHDGNSSSRSNSWWGQLHSKLRHRINRREFAEDKGPEPLDDSLRFVSLYEAFWRSEDFESIFPSEANRSQMIELVSAVIASPRFRDIQVGEFTYEYNDERYNDKQFAAMTFLLPDETEFISLRGTEATFVGWREDFELAFNKEIPSQHSALAYINEVHAHAGNREMMVAGHSKGGNTAVFAASKVSPEIQRYIRGVYSFDGPGFITDLMESDGYKTIEPRIHKIIPQDSFIGLMFEGREPYGVARSTASGLLQHFLFSWQVDTEQADFLRLDGVTENALNIANSYVEWTNSLGMTERRQVIDSIFNVLESTGYTTFTEVADNISTAAPVMWNAVSNSNPQNRDIVISAFTNLFSRIFGFNRYIVQVDSFLQRLPFRFGQNDAPQEIERDDGMDRGN